MVNNLSWILPFIIIMGSLVDAVLVYIYMKFVHQWKDILTSEEVSNPQLESKKEQLSKTSTETPTEQLNETSVEFPLGCHLRRHPDMHKNNPKNWQSK